jgi:hypothetical protein
MERLEYTLAEEKQLRITEIEAILENNLFESIKEEKRLVEEKKELAFQLELMKEI